MANRILLQNSICRICLNQTSNYKSLLSKMDTDDRTVVEVLSFITNVNISVDDKYPEQVCNDCFVAMCKADEFIKRCIHSENLFKSKYFNCSIDDSSKPFYYPTFDDLKPKPLENLEQKYVSLSSTTQSKQEISVLQTIDHLGNTDSKFNNLGIIKEEHDEFLQEDLMEDLADSIVIENNQIPSKITIDISNSKICICGFVCTDQYELDSHIKECKHLIDQYDTNTAQSSFNYLGTQITDEKTELHCPKCGQIFEYRTLYSLHLNTHKKKATVKHTKFKKYVDSEGNDFKIHLSCPECNENLPDMTSLKLHLKKHKDINRSEKVDTFQCSMCMRHFSRKLSLIAHIKRHEDKAHKIYTCKACKREFRHQAHLDNHIVLVHSKDKGFTCNKCNKSFTSQDCLEHHLEGHKLQKKHQCKVCNKTFTVLSTLTEHMRTHTGEKPFLCSICGKGFSQKNNMAQHVRRHQGLKPFKCEYCDRRFVSKGELDAHTRKHSGAHPFVCDECGNSFTTSSSLTKHRRIHSGERPYACDLCHMRFTALGTLKNHRRTHTGEKPYQCSHCEKAFTQRTDLVSHIRCHTGERPYTCACCGQGFRKASALKVHLKIHGKDTLVM